MTSCQFDSRLVTFRSGIAKEGLVGAGVGREPIGQLCLSGCVVQIADVVELLHLGSDGGGECLVVVTECTGGDAGDKVEIGLVAVIDQGAAGAGCEGNGVTPVCFVHAAFEQVGCGRGTTTQFRGGSEGRGYCARFGDC